MEPMSTGNWVSEFKIGLSKVQRNQPTSPYLTINDVAQRGFQSAEVWFRHDWAVQWCLIGIPRPLTGKKHIYNQCLPSGNQPRGCGNLPQVWRFLVGKITDFYGPFSSKPCLITGGQVFIWKICSRGPQQRGGVGHHSTGRADQFLRWKSLELRGLSSRHGTVVGDDRSDRCTGLAQVGSLGTTVEMVT